ncbi:hypothetical protein PAXINDRAFT_170337 [Paxillus involutus ATCC 200175]|uniref:Uncharacterized protein n=1 Tax=Paxillus involutus ATCC 200175 TaxID=664439 RepID=A0A0C9SW27_PAXIN|nr:hypothetical protein PAXINDRAFT_170337 [Paxillus involutus ATCC 200175]
MLWSYVRVIDLNEKVACNVSIQSLSSGFDFREKSRCFVTPVGSLLCAILRNDDNGPEDTKGCWAVSRHEH